MSQTTTGCSEISHSSSNPVVTLRPRCLSCTAGRLGTDPSLRRGTILALRWQDQEPNSWLMLRNTARYLPTLLLGSAPGERGITMEDLTIVEEIIRKDATVIEQCEIVGSYETGLSGIFRLRRPLIALQ